MKTTWLVGMGALALLGCSSARNNSNNNSDGSTSQKGDMAISANCTAAKRQFVANQVLLPTSGLATDPTAYGFDFNGDESPENKLGALLALINSLSSSAGSPQSAVDTAIKDTGTFLILMEVTGDSLVDSQCASVEVSTALPKMTPPLDGTGIFVQSAYKSSLPGTILAGALATTSPLGTKTPPTIQVKLPLASGSAPVDLTLTAAVVHGNIDATTPSIAEGRIYGAVKNSDLRDKTLPAIAKSLTTILKGNFDATTQDAIRNLLDKGNCGSAVAKDNIIDTCELTDGTLSSAFTPDLDLYSDTGRDADGNVVGTYGTYAPKPSAENSLDNDCLSFGVAFTAVGAQF